MSAPSDFNFASFFQKKATAAAFVVEKSAAEYAKNPCIETAVRLKMDIDSWTYYDAARRATECHGL
jgi:hypothetical protein